MDESQQRGLLGGPSVRLQWRRTLSVSLVVAAVGSLLSTSGCAAWRGARLYHTGTRALERGDVPQALADLEEAAVLVPEASEVHNNLGLAQLSAGQDDRALRSFERATELDCDNASASDNLRNLQVRLQRAERSAAVDRVSRPATGHDRPRGGTAREEPP